MLQMRSNPSNNDLEDDLVNSIIKTDWSIISNGFRAFDFRNKHNESSVKIVGDLPTIEQSIKIN